LTLTGAQSGIHIEAASPTICHCRIEGNAGPGLDLYRSSKPQLQNCIIAGNRGPGIAMHVQVGRFRQYNSPRVTNCTIVENLGYGLEGGKPVVINSIVYFNQSQSGDLQIESEEPVLAYCDVQGAFPGEGNFDADPYLVSLGVWVDPNAPNAVVGCGEPGAIWISGDYHLQSETGRWDSENGDWASDPQTSPCIDAGNPATPVGQELDPNGGRINLGTYGGTWQASMARDAARR
jgi:parallel beta-helix repeat protein